MVSNEIPFKQVSEKILQLRKRKGPQTMTTSTTDLALTFEDTTITAFNADL